MAGIGTVALPNRPADTEADGSGGASAEWPGPVRYCTSAHYLMNLGIHTNLPSIHYIFTIFFTIFFRHDFQ